ncbi:ATP synthase mitochondrial F1 complex assembly factor 2 [Dispira simplex]|nr:ATP synthase mitochondrial F1 complex assembly factor 2 [Dispira simplex]
MWTTNLIRTPRWVSQLVVSSSRRLGLRRLTSTISEAHSIQDLTNVTTGELPQTQPSKPPTPPRQPTRFWKKVTLDPTTENGGGWTVNLDQRPIRTPEGQRLVLGPHQRTLGLLLVGEWDSQDRVLKPHALPLTSLVARSIDGLHTPQQRQTLIDQLMRYLHTDAICNQQTFPQTLVDLQTQHWTPVIEWVQTHYGVTIHTTDQLFGMSQSVETERALRAHVETFSRLQLAAFERAILHTKSFLLGLALIQRKISVEDAVRAAQVEVLAQIKQWGYVEDTHDVNEEDMRRMLGAVACTLLTNKS